MSPSDISSPISNVKNQNGITTPKDKTSSSTLSSANKNGRTPVNNNYAAPHTPIASAKRRRQPPTSSRRSLGGGGGGGSLHSVQEGSVSAPATTTTITHTATQENQRPSDMNVTPIRQMKLNDTTSPPTVEQTMSPMHPPTRVPPHMHGQEEDDKSISPRTALDMEEEVEKEDEESNEGKKGSWVGGIFSPVLNFLSKNEGDDEEDYPLDEVNT